MMPFAWFTNNSKEADKTVTFYAELLGWEPTDGPGGMTVFAGKEGPFAGVDDVNGSNERSAGWLPFAEVADVQAAIDKASEMGATVLTPKSQGPAGFFGVIRDPGGAVVALWESTPEG